MSDTRTAALLPPEGAEPGSWWSLVYGEAPAWPFKWLGSEWYDARSGRTRPPSDMTAWRLADPTGAGAAVALLEATLPDGMSYRLCRNRNYKGLCYQVAVIDAAPVVYYGADKSSYLAAAKEAIAEWQAKPE